MDLTNYAGLKSAIAQFLNRADLDDVLGSFIAIAEAQMFRRFAVRTSEGKNYPRRLVKRADLSLALAAEYLGLPDDFLGLMDVSLDVRRLDYLSPSNLDAEKFRNNWTGAPRFYSIIGSELQFYPVADAAYTVKLTYLYRPPALSGENWILTDYPDAYLYGALTASAPYLKHDERAAVWGALFQAAIEDICNADPLPTSKARLGSDVPGANPIFDPALLS